MNIHALLIHGAAILASSILPIGMMSEEAQEALNKDNKLFRLQHARETSRTDSQVDSLRIFFGFSGGNVEHYRLPVFCMRGISLRFAHYNF